MRLCAELTASRAGCDPARKLDFDAPEFLPVPPVREPPAQQQVPVTGFSLGASLPVAPKKPPRRSVPAPAVAARSDEGDCAMADCDDASSAVCLWRLCGCTRNPLSRSDRFLETSSNFV